MGTNKKTEMGQNLIVGLCFFVWPSTEMTGVISVGGHRKTHKTYRTDHASLGT